MNYLLSLLVILSIGYASCDFHYLVMGDWGGQNNPYGGNQAAEQLAVAKQMGVIGAKYNISFVLNVGDNFYPAGVQSATDPLWATDFVNVYTAPSLKVPWVSALGNHDYGGNVPAQINWNGDSRWVLPNRYYATQFPITSSGEKATFIMLDTNPISYQCSSAPSSCTGGDPNTVAFWTNVQSQNWTPQLNWLQSTLAATTTDWIIVAGHHPNYWIDKYSYPYVVDIFSQYNVAAYYCGHVHDMEHFNVYGYNTDYFISGAGSLASDFPIADIPKLQATEAENERLKSEWVTSNEWTSKKAGFAHVYFDSTASKMTTTFYDYTGTVLNTFVTARPAPKNK